MSKIAINFFLLTLSTVFYGGMGIYVWGQIGLDNKTSIQGTQRHNDESTEGGKSQSKIVGCYNSKEVSFDELTPSILKSKNVEFKVQYWLNMGY